MHKRGQTGQGVEKLPKPTGAALMWATIRWRENKNVWADRIMKVGMFKWVLCKETVSPLPECFMGMSITSGWGTLPLPKYCKTTLCG